MSWDWEKLKEQQQSRSGGPVPPQMDDIVNQLKKIKIPGGPLLAVAIGLIALAVYSGTFTVTTGSVGVVQRFGEYVRTATDGLNFKIPFGVETVKLVREDRVFKEEFGIAMNQTDLRSRSGRDADVSNEALMLTGDLNVAVVPWIVQYRINDPYNYLFKVKDPEGLLRDLSEASMRLVVGDRSINEVITKRDEIAVDARQVLQNELDLALTGIHVVTIELKRTNVPGPVQASFNEVNQAIQEKEKTIYQAREEYNKAIPAARGKAERTIRAAEGYALDRVNRAQGDASRFQALYAEYNKAKDVTKRRLYLEAIRELLPKLGQKYIVDADQKNLLPLLNLGTGNGIAQ